MDADALLGTFTALVLAFFWTAGMLLRLGRVEFWRPIEGLVRRAGHDKGGSVRPSRAVSSLWLRARRRDRVRNSDLAGMCMEVAARLDTGADVASAWEATWARRFTGPVTQTAEGLPEDLARQRGSEARMVVSAARFSVLTGAPLAEVLRGTGRSLTLMEEGAAAQKTAFAGPKLSARILAVLPLVGLMAGELLGANPLGWFTSGVGPGFVGAGGAAFSLAGFWLSRRMIRRARASGGSLLEAPLICELAASGLRGGAAVPGTLRHLGAALDEAEYVRIGDELLLGATWKEAWDPTPAGGELLADALQPAWEDGVSPVELLEHAAGDARARASAAAQTAAQELSVKLALPLAGLLLPAFVLLGLVPVFFTLVGTQLG